MSSASPSCSLSSWLDRRVASLGRYRRQEPPDAAAAFQVARRRWQERTRCARQTRLTGRQPHGVREADCLPVTGVLADGMSEQNAAIVVAELTGGEVRVVGNDVAAAQSVRVPQLQGLVFNRRWSQCTGIRTRSNPAAWCAGARTRSLD
jgi:hypothetical protein